MPKPKSKKATRSAVTVKAGRSNRAASSAMAKAAMDTAVVQPTERTSELTDELYVANLFMAAEALPPAPQTEPLESAPLNSAPEASGVAVAADSQQVDAGDASISICDVATSDVAICDADASDAALIIETASEPEAVATLIAAEPIVTVEPESLMSATDTAASSTDAPVLTLPAQCLLRDAVELRQQLLPLLEDARPVTLDVRVVERIDTAAIQVLLCFTRERARQQLPVAWLGCTTSLVDAAKTLGLQALMNIPAAEAA